MTAKWADKYYDFIRSYGLSCEIINRSNGWIETMDVEGNLYYTKSKTYDAQRREYFIGVDPKKQNSDWDFTLICGGENGKIRDLFIIPWDIFITTIIKGEASNTYKSPKKEYWQFKSYIRDRDEGWYLSVIGGQRPKIDISQFRYNLDDSIKFFKTYT